MKSISKFLILGLALLTVTRANSFSMNLPQTGTELMPTQIKPQIQLLTVEIDKAIGAYADSAKTREKLGFAAETGATPRLHSCQLDFSLIGQDPKVGFIIKDLTGLNKTEMVSDWLEVYTALYFRCVDDDGLERVVPELIRVICLKSTKDCKASKQ